jgi:hypothetical protein
MTCLTSTTVEGRVYVLLEKSLFGSRVRIVARAATRPLDWIFPVLLRERGADGMTSCTELAFGGSQQPLVRRAMGIVTASTLVLSEWRVLNSEPPQVLELAVALDAEISAGLLQETGVISTMWLMTFQTAALPDWPVDKCRLQLSHQLAVARGAENGRLIVKQAFDPGDVRVVTRRTLAIHHGGMWHSSRNCVFQIVALHARFALVDSVACRQFTLKHCASPQQEHSYGECCRSEAKPEELHSSHWEPPGEVTPTS